MPTLPFQMYDRKLHAWMKIESLAQPDDLVRDPTISVLYYYIYHHHRFYSSVKRFPCFQVLLGILRRHIGWFTSCFLLFCLTNILCSVMLPASTERNTMVFLLDVAK